MFYKPQDVFTISAYENISSTEFRVQNHSIRVHSESNILAQQGKCFRANNKRIAKERKFIFKIIHATLKLGIHTFLGEFIGDVWHWRCRKQFLIVPMPKLRNLCLDMSFPAHKHATKRENAPKL